MAWLPQWLRVRPAVLIDVAPSTPPVDERTLLRRVAAEAVILQDQAEAVLAAVVAAGVHRGYPGLLVRERDEQPEPAAV